MKKEIVYKTIIILAIVVPCLFVNTAPAYWVWTPETKKFINPKYAVKDSPKEQFDWAMSFYEAKDYQRAATEFEKLTKSYEYSEYASKAQYYVGLSYENMGKFYIAFQNYQKAIDNFPHIENIDEIIARQFNIGKLYESRDNPKVMGTDIMAPLDRAVEIYKKVVENEPYGKLADEAQYSLGVALKRSERYDEAIPAFQKVIDDYRNSRFADKARYEVADCAYKASLKPAYDVGPTDKAIQAFEEFAETNKDNKLSKEAEKTVQRLKDKAAEKSLLSAKFYESQKHYESAIIYYQDVLDRFPDCSFVNEARSKIDTLSRKLKKPGYASITAEGPEKSEKKAWSPLNFTKPSKPKQTEVAKETPVKKKAWTPFNFTKPAKEKKTVVEKPLEPKPIEMETPAASPEVKSENPETKLSIPDENTDSSETSLWN